VLILALCLVNAVSAAVSTTDSYGDAVDTWAEAHVVCNVGDLRPRDVDVLRCRLTTLRRSAAARREH